jgi:hypothetical protein
MLTLRSFRIAIAIIAYFDLEVKQFDIINIFINAHHNIESALVICHLPNGFKAPGKLVEVYRVLYSLVNSPSL